MAHIAATREVVWGLRERAHELIGGGQVHQIQKERLINRSASISTHRPCGINQSHHHLRQCQASNEGGHLVHSRDEGVHLYQEDGGPCHEL